MNMNALYAPHKKHWKTEKYEKLRNKTNNLIRVLFSLEVPSRQFSQMPDAHLMMSYRTDSDVVYPYGNICELVEKVRTFEVDGFSSRSNRGVAIVSNQRYKIIKRYHQQKQSWYFYIHYKF